MLSSDGSQQSQLYTQSQRSHASCQRCQVVKVLQHQAPIAGNELNIVRAFPSQPLILVILVPTNNSSPPAGWRFVVWKPSPNALKSSSKIAHKLIVIKALPPVIALLTRGTYTGLDIGPIPLREWLQLLSPLFSLPNSSKSSCLRACQGSPAGETIILKQQEVIFVLLHRVFLVNQE